MALSITTLRTMVLGHDQRQRTRASQTLLTLSVYLSFAVLQHVEVLLGLVDAEASWRLTAFNLTGGVVFYLVIRSGLNRRATRDPSLAFPQLSWAMTATAWSYAITGPARGAVILILMLVIVFGVFTLTTRQARVLALSAMAMLVAVMAWKATTDPTSYDPRVEAVHLAFAGVVLAATSALSIRIGRLRERLQSQRAELAAALEQIRALATHDELTGLTNRRAAMDLMRGATAARDPRIMSVALIDLDHFKTINDAHGHACGDAVLRRFATVVGSAIRTGDVLARWGGEEFLLVMPATGAEEADALVRRLRARLRDVSFDDIAPALRLTFSAGVAECGGVDDLEPAIERADSAMYVAKGAGRDRVVGPPSTRPAPA